MRVFDGRALKPASHPGRCLELNRPATVVLLLGTEIEQDVLRVDVLELELGDAVEAKANHASVRELRGYLDVELDARTVPIESNDENLCVVKRKVR